MPAGPSPFSLLEHWGGIGDDPELVVRLYKLQMDRSVPHVLGDFVEADYPGYESQELLPVIPQQLTVGDFGYLTSVMLVWEHAEWIDGENRLGGYLIVAEFPDGHDELVIWENFRSNILFNPHADPFGLVIYLVGRYFFVSAL